MPPLKIPGHPQASLGQSAVGPLLLSPGSWFTRFCCTLQETISQGLMVISSKRAYAIPKSAAPRAPVPVTDHHKSVPPQETIKHSSASVSVGSLGSGVHKVCLSPLSVYGGNGV